MPRHRHRMEPARRSLPRLPRPIVATGIAAALLGAALAIPFWPSADSPSAPIMLCHTTIPATTTPNTPSPPTNPAPNRTPRPDPSSLFAERRSINQRNMPPAKTVAIVETGK